MLSNRFFNKRGRKHEEKVIQTQLVEIITCKIGYRFRRSDLLEQALCHSSHVRDMAMQKRASHGVSHYERLEFLGDAVIDLVVSDLLMEVFPTWQEGELSKMRAAMVNTQALARLGRDLGLGELAIMSDAEAKNGGRTRLGVLTDLFEALSGAVYLDGGFESANEFLRPIFSKALDAQKQAGIVYDYKTALQELTQAQWGQRPHYQITNREGPDHEPSFLCSVTLANLELGQGMGASKKEAGQNAAQAALTTMQTWETNVQRELAGEV